ncbi:MAG: hypothetical protein PVH00_15025 [Gemmatimonadota bacterium]
MPARTTTQQLVALFAILVFAGCSSDEPTGAAFDETVDPMIPAASLGQADLHQALAMLRQRTAAWHNADAVVEAGYTTQLGCIDERVVQGVNADIARGMGYHPANLDLLFDDAVDLMSPETLVLVPRPGGNGFRLAAFDYFVPASAAWPSPGDGGAPPVLPEIGIPFTWSAVHGGWMFHIWLWENNPDGMFANWNPNVPLCDCHLDPQTGSCLP